MVCLASIPAACAKEAPDQEVQNPIIWADVPDLAVIRVRGTYYMSSTTMHLSPGLPIMKSRDLVNWQIVSYAYDTLGDNLVGLALALSALRRYLCSSGADVSKLLAIADQCRVLRRRRPCVEAIVA